MRALISVSDKTGVVEFADGLKRLGWDIIATGGTMKLLRDAGLEVINISDVTGFPEICDGRVKTLHPKVHGGLLARRDLPSHLEALRENGIEFIDMVCVNLYPFRQTIAKEGVSMEDAIENIDIGGPSMLRSAAKNYRDVTVVCDPQDYGRVLDEIRAGGNTRSETRLMLSAKAFTHTAQYDACIATYLREKAGLPESSSWISTSCSRCVTARIPTSRRSSTAGPNPCPSPWRSPASSTARSSPIIIYRMPMRRSISFGSSMRRFAWGSST